MNIDINKIKQLSQEVALQIAAGEVVERPANIVKELLENSLDAGATKITLSIIDGGKKLIRVQDNGSGMSRVDAQKCFDQHATSKLETINQLEVINTFGFRGEALASISSVAKVTLHTKTKNAFEGTAVVITHSKKESVDATSCQIGTDIIIEQLFETIPARKKFLKQTSTEQRQIQQLFYAFCFQSLSTHFILNSEQKTSYNCPPVQTLADRWTQLYTQQKDSILELIELKDSSIKITGIITDHQFARYDRSSIFIFVNNRWVKNSYLQSALIKGYQNVLPQGKFPAAVIHIFIDPHEVDINIHPRKEEVRFLHPRRVEQQLQLTAKTTLEKNIAEKIASPKHFSFDTPDVFVHKKNIQQDYFTQDFIPKIYKTESNSFTPFDFDRFFSQENNINQIDETEIDLHEKYYQTVDVELPKEIVQETQTVVGSMPYKLLGNFNNTYILVEHENNLLLVDQHAAHERVLYELFAHRFQDVAIVQLIFPITIELHSHAITLIQQYLGLLEVNGIVAEIFDETHIIIRATPVHLKNTKLDSLFHEMVSWIEEFQQLDTQEVEKNLHHNLRAQMACKAAVKAGDYMSLEQMEELLAQLYKTENKLTCPHGRPTMTLFSKYEIEKKFKRKV